MQDTLTNNRIKLLRKKVLSSPKPISITVNVSCRDVFKVFKQANNKGAYQKKQYVIALY